MRSAIGYLMWFVFTAVLTIGVVAVGSWSVWWGFPTLIAAFALSTVGLNISLDGVRTEE